MDARFEKFLFAVIGEGAGGTPLTVISALARRGSDPWTEAARLSALPKANAMEILTSYLTNIPPVWCDISDVRSTVARLWSLLPKPESKVAIVKRARPLDLKAYKLLPIICLVLFIAVTAGYAFL